MTSSHHHESGLTEAQVGQILGVRHSHMLRAAVAFSWQHQCGVPGADHAPHCTLTASQPLSCAAAAHPSMPPLAAA